jgi:DNA-binding SARP family transcriptional activator
VLPLGGPKQRSLLAMLVLHANEVVSSSRLIDALWGERPPATALAAVHNYASQLRREVGLEDVLVTRAPGYVLELDPDQLDLRRFERLVEEARGAVGESAAAKLREALMLWRGAPFADFAFEPFAQTEIVRLEELWLVALEGRIEADLASGRHAELVGELEALVRGHPLRERLRAQLMVALYRSGRQAEALEAYQNARDTLVDELGIEPREELRRLQRAILDQDPSLELASLPPRPTPAPEAALPAAREPMGEQRKTVTVLSCGLVDPSAFEGLLDPEARRVFVDRYCDTVCGVLERHGATVERLVDDAVLAVFGVPLLHEDDALRALRAAVELDDALAPLAAQLERERGVRLELGVGVSTGEVLVGHGAAAVRGDVVTTAVALQRAAPPGAVVFGETTRRLVRDAVRADAFEVPRGGRVTQIQAWKLAEVRTEAPAIARRLDAPLVDREPELDQLRQAFDRAVRQRTSYLFTLFGPPGIGKTRLSDEFVRSGTDALVLVGRCLSHGEGIT